MHDLYFNHLACGHTLKPTAHAREAELEKCYGAVQMDLLNSSMSSVKEIRESSKNIRVMKDIIIM